MSWIKKIIGFMCLTIVFNLGYAYPVAWHNWNSTIVCPNVVIYSPKTAADIPTKGGPYRIVGMGHSWNIRSCNFKGVIITSHFNSSPHLFKLNNDEVVEVGSGVLLQDLLNYLEKNGRTLPTFPTLPWISIGGAIATATHGTSFTQGTLSESVVGVEVVPNSYQKINLSAFSANVGKLGVITKVKLKTVPVVQLERQVNVINIETLFNEWYRLQNENDRMQAWIDLNSGEVELIRFNRLGSQFRQLANLTPHGYLSAHLLRNQVGTPGQVLLIYTPVTVPYIEAEYIVNRTKELAAIKGLRSFIKQNHIELVRPVLIRFGGVDHLPWLSPANSSEPVVFINVDLAKGQEENMGKIEKYLITNFSARYHWGKWYSHDPALMDLAYGKQIKKFDAYQKSELKKLFGSLMN